MAGGRPKGSKQRKISIAGLEGLKPRVLAVLIKALDGNDDTRQWQTAIQLLKFMFPPRVEMPSATNEPEFQRVAELLAKALVSSSQSGCVPSDNNEVQK